MAKRIWMVSDSYLFHGKFIYNLWNITNLEKQSLNRMVDHIH